MVEIKLSFANVDAAIVALDKLRAAPVVAVKVEQPKAPRKERNDKGTPRGQYKPREGAKEEGASNGSTADPAPGKAAEEAANPEATTAAASSTGEPPVVMNAPSTSVTETDMKAALDRYFKAKGAEQSIALLAEHGVKKARELKPEQYAGFVADINAKLAA